MELFQVYEATEWLHQTVIPQFAMYLDGIPKRKRKDQSKKLTELLHDRGINCRHFGISCLSPPPFQAHRLALYLGALRALVKSPYWRRIILLEMIARATKERMREIWRQETKKDKKPGEEANKRLLIDLLNLLFGCSKKSARFWNDELRPLLQAKFELPPLTSRQAQDKQEEGEEPTLTETVEEGGDSHSEELNMKRLEEGEQQMIKKARKSSTPRTSTTTTEDLMDEKDFFKVRDAFSAPHRNRKKALSGSADRADRNDTLCYLFSRITTMLGLTWTTQAAEEYSTHVAAFNFKAPFDETELVVIDIVVKKLNVMALAQGYALKAKLLKNTNRAKVREEARKEKETMMKKKGDSDDSSSSRDSTDSQEESCLSLSKEREKEKETELADTQVQRRRQHHLSRLAIRKFREALSCHTKSKEALVQLGDVYFMIGKYKKAK